MSFCSIRQEGSFKEKTLRRIKTIFLQQKKEIIIQDIMEFLSSSDDTQINFLWNKICIRENYIKDTDLDWKCFI